MLGDRLTIPFACRRNAKGSFDPVGSKPNANIPAIVSALSAIESTAPSILRDRIFGRLRLVLVVDGVAIASRVVVRHSRSSSCTRAYNPPTIPCSSVNSLTSSVVRSVLARHAPCEPHRVEPQCQHRWMSLASPAAQALHPQRLVVIAAKVFLERHALEHVHAFAQRSFWSVCQKNRASLNRARSTRSLPWRISPADRHLCSALQENAAAVCRWHLPAQNISGDRASLLPALPPEAARNSRIEAAENYRRPLREIHYGFE